MEPALFSPSSLFRCSGGGGDDDECVRSATAGGGAGEGRGTSSSAQEVQLQQSDTTFEERRHAFPGGVELLIQEFSFHQLNANLLWPGTFAFSEWLFKHQACLQGQRILELGSGTGALAIFLQKMFEVDITTSDYDDEEVEENIAHNCRANGLPVMPHIRHTWGDTFPTLHPDWELIIASDILLYVKQYLNLIKTLCFLLKSYNPRDKKVGPVNFHTAGKEVQLHLPVFLMSWRRRIGREDEALFFNGCADAGLVTEHLGSRVYCISLGGKRSLESTSLVTV